MAVTSILDVDVQQQSFERFLNLWNDYQEQLKKQPEIWTKIAGIQAQAAGGLNEFKSSFEAHIGALTEVNEIEAEHGKLAMRNESLWRDTASHSGSFAKNLTHAATVMQKWAPFLFGAVVFGSAFGIDRLAADASGQRQQAMGLGGSIGQLKAFSTNFARVGDIGGLLGSVNQAETDISSPAYRSWLTLGLGAMSGNAVKDSMRYLDAVRAFTERMPLNMLGPMAQAYGIDLDSETLRRIRATSSAEWAGMEKGTLADINRMNIPGARNLQELSTQLSRNLSTISATFETQLAKSAPVLKSFSDAVTRATVGLLNAAGQWVQDPKSALENRLKQAFHIVNPLAPNGTIGLAWDAIQGLFTRHHVGTTLENALGPPARQFAHWATTPMRQFYSSEADRLDPSGMLQTMGMLESGMNPIISNSSKGAAGMMQFMPTIATALGIDPRNAEQSLRGAEVMRERLMREYGGDIAKVLAAYNWGEGHLNKDIAKYGENWLQHAPEETRSYVASGELRLFLRDLRTLLAGSAKIDVRLPPGSSATASISGLGATR